MQVSKKRKSGADQEKDGSKLRSYQELYVSEETANSKTKIEQFTTMETLKGSGEKRIR